MSFLRSGSFKVFPDGIQHRWLLPPPLLVVASGNSPDKPATFRPRKQLTAGAVRVYTVTVRAADDKGGSTAPGLLAPQIAASYRQDAGPPQVNQGGPAETQFLTVFGSLQVWHTGTCTRPWAGQAFIRTGADSPLFCCLFQPGPEMWMQLMY